MIAKTELNKLKKKLTEEKKEIEEKLKTHKKMPDFGSDTDPDEETDESGEFSNQLAIFQTYKNRLADVNLALKKIQNGKYGVCEKCKSAIALKLLLIDPESKLCQKCKKKN